MAKVSWIKIETEMFNNVKIGHIRKLPEGNNIVLILVMLLTMAGRCNANGLIFLTENIPYNEKLLADELSSKEGVRHEQSVITGVERTHIPSGTDQQRNERKN